MKTLFIFMAVLSAIAPNPRLAPILSSSYPLPFTAQWSGTAPSETVIVYVGTNASGSYAVTNFTASEGATTISATVLAWSDDRDFYVWAVTVNRALLHSDRSAVVTWALSPAVTNVVLSWNGIGASIQSSASVYGPWTPLAAATGMALTQAVSGTRFFRANKPLSIKPDTTINPIYVTHETR